MINHMNLLNRCVSTSEVFEGWICSAASLESFITNLLIKPNRFVMNPICLSYSLQELVEPFQRKVSAGDAQ